MRLVTLAIVVAAVLFGVEAAAVQEQQLPYSGVALTPSGAPVADGLHQMEFRLYTGATASEPVWAELQLVQTRAGSYQVVLGQSRPLLLTTGQQYWLEVLCDGVSLGRMPLALLPSQTETKVAARSLQELHLNPVQSAAPDGWVRAGLPTLGGATPPQPLVVNTCEECTTTFWALTGNAGTNPNNNFLGTTDNQPLIIRTNNVNRVRITTGGQIEVLNSARSVSLGEGAGLSQDLTAFRNNVFVGFQAGSATQTGIQNVAVGSGALSQNDGSSNTALGSNAMSTLTTGDYNTAIGYGAEVGDGLTNATAIGAFAFAGQSNTVVIGSIQMVNGAPATANVGIGTTTPMNRLHVVSTADPLRLEGLLVNSALDNVLVVDASGVVKKRSLSGFVGSTAWLLTGNTLSGGEVLGSLNLQPLVLVTNNTERVRITAAGDVGIGTSMPGARLDVVNPTGGGVLRLQAVVGQTGALLEWVDDMGNPLGVIDNSGLVGIGTATPVQKLHVVGNGTVSAVFVEGGVGVGTVNPLATLHVYDEGSTPGATQVMIQAGANQAGVNLLEWRDNGGTVLLGGIDDAGNLFVNTNTTLGDAAGDVVTVNAGTVALPNIPALSTATEVLVWNGGNVERRSAEGLAWLLTGNGGTNPAVNFLGTTDAQPLVIRTNNLERMRITAAGDVGIGTSTPTATLDVVGTAQVSGNTSIGGSLTVAGDATVSGTTVALPNIPALSAATEVLVWNAGNVEHRSASGLISGFAWMLGGNDLTLLGEQKLGTQSNHDLPIITNNVERMRITAAGNVGIGTNAPAARLDVVNPTGGGVLRLQAVLGQMGALLEWVDETGTPWGVIDNSGLVGIGTAAPVQKLHVVGNGAVSAVFVEGGVGVGTVNPLATLHVYDEGTLTPGATQVIIQAGANQTGVNLLEWWDNAGTVLGGIDDAGNLFVNTNTTLGDAAGDVVTVNAGTVALPNIPALSAATEVLVWNGGNVEHRSASGLISGFAWMLGGNDLTLLGEQKLGTQSNHDLPIITNNVERMRITAAGDVGIGTSTPGARLHVVGTGRFDGQLTVTTGGAAITGNSTVTGTLGVSSDVSVGGNLAVTGNATVSGATVSLPNIPALSTATEVLVWNAGNVEHRSASGLISGFAWMLGGNTLTSEQTLGTLSAHDLPIITAGTEKVRITQAGHVLPGADNAYDLGSATQRWRSGYFGTSVVVGTSVSLVAGTPDRLEYSGDGIVRASGYLAVETGGAERLRVTAAGDVVVQNQAAGTPTTVLRVLGGNGGAGATQVVLQAGTGQSGVNLLEWRDGTGQLIGVIDDAGFMGIGVNNAGFGGIAAYLHVYSNTAQPAAVFENGIVRIGNIGGSGVSAGPDLQVWDEPGATQVILQLGTAQTGVNLLEWQNAVGTVLGRIDDAGNLFVNTNTTLGDAATDAVTMNAGTVALPNIPALSTATEVLVWNGGNVEHRSASGLISGFAWMLGGNTLTSEQTLGTLSAHDLPIITAGTEKVRITQAGDVGIGTTSPAARLHVVGTGRFDGQLTVTTGGAAITGNSTVTGTLTVSSDVSVGGNGSVTGNLTVAGNTTLGDAAGDVVTVNAGTVALPNIPSGSTATEVLVWNGGNVEHRSASGLISGFAWMLGGNTLTSEQTLGTLSAHDLPIITAGTEKVRITQAGHVLPGADNAYDLGSATQRWRSGYFGTSVVVGTSVSLVAGTPDRLEYSGDGIVRASGYLAVETGGAERLRVTAAGDVVVQNQAAGTPTTVLRVLGGNGGAGATQVVLQAGTGQSGVNLLEWRDGTGQLIGVIDDAGFMGIGVNNAGFGGIAAYLHVYSNTAQPAAVFENGIVRIGNIGGSGVSAGPDLQVWDEPGATQVILQLGTAQTGVNLLEWQNAVGTVLGRIDDAGNLFVNTNTTLGDAATDAVTMNAGTVAFVAQHSSAFDGDGGAGVEWGECGAPLGVGAHQRVCMDAGWEHAYK
jgi:hypothetical protein